jgi:hypothetical protein
MRRLSSLLLFTGLFLPMTHALAYSLDCSGDGQSCKVYCDDKTYIGTETWNGSQWSDGQRWDKDKDVVAAKMVAAFGSSCK